MHEACMHEACMRHACRHLSSTSNPNRRILVVIPARICTQVCRGMHEAGMQAPLQHLSSTSPAPLLHLSSTSPDGVTSMPPICRQSGANLVPLAAPFCEKRERCRKFNFGPTTSLLVTKKLFWTSKTLRGLSACQIRESPRS